MIRTDLTRLLSAATLALLLGGCTNALYFATKNRASLTIESEPANPQAPVTGNFGAREQVVVVTPGKNGEASDTGEALSMIGRFRFAREPDKGIVVRTAFVTGAAASNLNRAESQAAASVVSALSFDPGLYGRCIQRWINADRNLAPQRNRTVQDFIDRNALIDDAGISLAPPDLWATGEHNSLKVKFVEEQGIECGDH